MMVGVLAAGAAGGGIGVSLQEMMFGFWERSIILNKVYRTGVLEPWSSGVLDAYSVPDGSQGCRQDIGC